MKSKKHIDDAQPATVDEHFQLILDDRTTIDPDFVKVTPDDLPEWFDKRLFKTGQEYYKDNLLGFGAAHIAGLVSILAVPDILEVLVYTKKSSTVCLSYKRFAETLLLMYALFHSDMLDPNSKWFKAMNVVRWRHATVSKRHQKDGHHGIYQKDMVITQFGFIGYVFICPEKVGLAHTTYEQKMGFNHFWRVTGHLLGITDRINICRETVEETTELCRRVAYEILAKHLENPLPEFEKLSSNAVTGMWYIDVTIDTDAFMYKTYDLTGVKYKKPLGWYSTLMLYRGMFLLYMCSVPYIGKVVREIFNVILTLTYLMLEYCPVAAWLAFGKQKSQLCLYPNI